MTRRTPVTTSPPRRATAGRLLLTLTAVAVLAACGLAPGPGEDPLELPSDAVALSAVHTLAVAAAEAFAGQE